MSNIIIYEFIFVMNTVPYESFDFKNYNDLIYFWFCQWAVVAVDDRVGCFEDFAVNK